MENNQQKPTHLSLMMSYGASKEKNLLEVCFESEYIKLIKQITSRKIIDDAIWTQYRLLKMNELLLKVSAIDDSSFTIKHVLPNVLVVQWWDNLRNPVGYTMYRLVY